MITLGALEMERPGWTHSAFRHLSSSGMAFSS